MHIWLLLTMIFPGCIINVLYTNSYHDATGNKLGQFIS